MATSVDRKRKLDFYDQSINILPNMDDLENLMTKLTYESISDKVNIENKFIEAISLIKEQSLQINILSKEIKDIKNGINQLKNGSFKYIASPGEGSTDDQIPSYIG